MRAAVDPADQPLVSALRGKRVSPGGARALLARAEIHGLAGVLYPGLRSDVERDVARRVEMREAARELEHRAHLRLLRTVDEALASANIDAVALKGPLLAERLYEAPSTRVTSDVDLLVAERDLDVTIAALRTAGYVASTQPSERRFRREHHHLHLSHPHALPLELHFHAYRGFGSVLRSEPLIARKRPFPGFLAMGVLAPADELVYLAVHAAAHRVGRLGWLYDLQLLVSTMTAEEIGEARVRAREAGYSRVVSFVVELLIELLAVDASRLGPLRGERFPVARTCVREPRGAMGRSLSRFVYSISLCEDRKTCARYMWNALGSYGRRLFVPA